MSLDDLLGSKLPGVKFPEVGARVIFTVEDGERRVATTIQGETRTFKDGNPITQLVLTGTVDGEKHRWFFKWEQEKALSAALEAAGAKLERGGLIAMARTADRPSTQAGFGDAHTFRAEYKAPTTEAGSMFASGGSISSAEGSQPTQNPEPEPVESLW